VRFLKQQSLITAYRLPAKENKLPEFAVFVFRLQQAKGNCRFPIVRVLFAGATVSLTYTVEGIATLKRSAATVFQKR
jgi:hypothetical protein